MIRLLVDLELVEVLDSRQAEELTEARSTSPLAAWTRAMIRAGFQVRVYIQRHGGIRWAFLRKPDGTLYYTKIEGLLAFAEAELAAGRVGNRPARIQRLVDWLREGGTSKGST